MVDFDYCSVDVLSDEGVESEQGEELQVAWSLSAFWMLVFESVSHTSKKYFVNRFSVMGLLFSWILSRMHCI